MERGRTNNPNFALLFRNDGTMGDATRKLHLPLEVDGKTELIEAFGIDRLAAEQLVGYHLHPETGRPWLWEGDRSPENTSLTDLPQISTDAWDDLWREIVNCGATVGLIEQVGIGPASSAGDVAIKGIEGKSNLVPANIDRPPPPAETMRALLQRLADKNCFEDREEVLKDTCGRMAEDRLA